MTSALTRGAAAQVFTFKPKINASPGVQSRLKISSDPQNYVQRLEHELQMQQRQQAMRSQVCLSTSSKGKRLLENGDFLGCFQPSGESSDWHFVELGALRDC